MGWDSSEVYSRDVQGPWTAANKSWFGLSLHDDRGGPIRTKRIGLRYPLRAWYGGRRASAFAQLVEQISRITALSARASLYRDACVHDWSTST